MTAINLIAYFLVVYAMTFMLVYSNGPFHIFLHMREKLERLHPQFGELLSCCFCTPANLGWIMSLFNTFILTSVAFTPFHILWGGAVGWVWIMVFDALITGGVVYLIDTFQTYFDKNS